MGGAYFLENEIERTETMTSVEYEKANFMIHSCFYASMCAKYLKSEDREHI